MPRTANHELRNHILRTAFQLFCQKGYDNVTTREIAAASGIERGLLHHYFNQKQEILFTYYNDFGSYLFEYVEASLEGHDSLEVIATVHCAYYNIIFSRPEWVQLIVSILNSRELTKIKIDNTIRSYDRQNKVGQVGEQVYLSTLIMIGAEVELVLNMVDGRVDTTVSELASIINRIFLICMGKSEPEAKDMARTARHNAAKMDCKEYEDRFKKRYDWYE